jgi:hypothetical protein
MFCPDCASGLDDVPVGEPCPRCGGERRSAWVVAETATAEASALDPGIRTREEGSRPWGEKWQVAMYCFDRLEEAYDPAYGRLDIQDVRARVTAFFSACFDLRDWIKSARPDLKEKAAKLFNNPGVLSQCADIANTYKHRDRSQAGARTARVLEVAVEPGGGASVSLDLDCDNPETSVRDALELARGCLAAWRAFFLENKLIEPS